MPRLVLFATLVILLAACGSTPAPSLSATQASIPTNAALVPLPEGLSGIPAPGNEFTAEVAPISPADELEIGLAVNYTIGHCGLGTPIDVDGSLWDPVGSAAVLTEAQRGEMVNETSVVMVLIDDETLQMQTPSGALLTLTRHDGPRRYFLCD
jgi:hypothetical protein